MSILESEIQEIKQKFNDLIDWMTKYLVIVEVPTGHTNKDKLINMKFKKKVDGTEFRKLTDF